ncbi:MAG: hypothetical protein L3J24_11020 [Xanthomonadales bacterium]|nr:hypothetical protein [Xanthomonadales bacterium]
MLSKRVLVIIILLLFAALVTVYPGSPVKGWLSSLVTKDPLSCERNNVLCEEFKQVAPLPSWWDEVDIGIVEISDYDELSAYWQSEKRCCSEQEIKTTNRQFFKAMYLEIIEHTNDPDIVVNAINLMDLTYLDYDYFYPLIMFALEHYPDYRKPLHACANCMTGDVLASILGDLRSYMAQENLQQEYVDLSLAFLDKRGMEMSDYYEARVYLALARSYKDLRQIPMARQVLTSMPERYSQSVKKGSLASTLRSADIMLKEISQPTQQ